MIPNVQISPNDLILQKEAGSKIPLLGLKKGQVINAKVAGLMVQGKVQLLVAGQKVVVKTDLPLMPGQEIKLELTQEKGTMSFKLLDSPPSSSPSPGKKFSLARFISQTGALPELGRTKDSQVNGILGKMALKSGKRDDQFLPRLLENMGITLEKKMGGLLVSMDRTGVKPALNALLKTDLKGALLNLMAMEKSGDEPLSKTVLQVSNTLEGFQQLNSQSTESNRFLLPFPILAGDQFNFGQLFVNTGKKGEEKEGPDNRVIQLAFLLNMTALGSVRAEFSIFKKAITGRFLLEDQEVCDHIKTLVPELKTKLSAIDYHAQKIECRVAEPKALSTDAFIQSMFDSENTHGLDLIV